MSEAFTSEEQKKRIKERLKNMASSTSCLDIDGLCVAVYRRTSPYPFSQDLSYELIVQRYKDIARRHNCILKGVYADEGWDDHTALDKLLVDCERGEIDIVSIRSTSYISRDINKVMEITREFEARSVAVCFNGGSIMGSKELEWINSPVLPPPDRWKIIMQHHDV